MSDKHEKTLGSVTNRAIWSTLRAEVETQLFIKKAQVWCVDMREVYIQFL